MKSLLALGLCAVALGAFASTASAAVRLHERVRYDTQQGFSDWHDTDVTFASGTELNRATRSFDYDGFATYAVIFFSQDQAAVIRLSNPLMCGDIANQQCVTKVFGNLTGTDKGGRNWEICNSAFC